MFIMSPPASTNGWQGYPTVSRIDVMAMVPASGFFFQMILGVFSRFRIDGLV